MLALGRIIRGILQKTSKVRAQDITENDIMMIDHHPLDEFNQLRVSIIKEVLEIRSREAILPDGWTWGEFETVLEDTCTTWYVFFFHVQIQIPKQP